MRLVFLAFLLALGMSASAAADGDQAATSLAVSEKAIGNTLPELSFRDTAGQNFPLQKVLGKPVLLTLIYTGCADVCPAIIESLAPAVEAGQEALGKDSFSVITIGFDTRNDTPERMRLFAREHNAGGENWHFLSTDQRTLEALASSVGFSFFPGAGGFDHMAQVTILDKTGKIYRQVYGSTFEPPQIVEPLKELVFSRERPFFSIQGLADRVKLFCTVYNPNTGRYYFNYSLFASIFVGAGSLLIVLLFLVKETRKAMRSRGAG